MNKVPGSFARTPEIEYDPLAVPAGMRRLEVNFHSADDVAAYLGEAAQLMEEAEIPAAERGELRRLLVDILARRHVQMVPTDEVVAEQLAQQARMQGPLGGLSLPR